ncbi:MAG: hypothetical protein ACJAWV_004049, partial [Flammeovirgaceae bacterium]
MKIFLHKSTAVFMALLVLLTTMSFSVDMHFCGETLVDFSFVKQAKTCGMEQSEAVSNSAKSTLTKNSCCSDKQLLVEGQDNLNSHFENLTFEQQTLFVVFIQTYFGISESIREQTEFTAS